jgi:ATPase subunit of ABC transporter with duplicated ATPase domains
MSLLLSCQGISKAYGAAPLFEQLSFGLFEGDRVGLVGPNGSGKSTLLGRLAGSVAVILVTHDRYLFERVCTVVLALDGYGGVDVFADYQQWEDAQHAQTQAQLPAAAKAAGSGQSKRVPTRIGRLSYTERREWEQMETIILAAEQALAAVHAAAHDVSVAANAVVLHQRYEALREAQPHVDRLYARWIGTLRRELLDHVVVLGRQHLVQLVNSYHRYYHEDRCHLTHERDTPDRRPVTPRPSPNAKVAALSRVGGLNHRYV